MQPVGHNDHGAKAMYAIKAHGVYYGPFTSRKAAEVYVTERDWETATIVYLLNSGETMDYHGGSDVEEKKA